MRRILTAVLLSLALLGTACGDDGDSNGIEAGQDNGSEERKRTPQEIVLASASETTAEKSSRILFEIRTTGQPELPEGVTIRGNGAFDYAGKRGAMTMTIPPLAGVEIGEIQAVFEGNVIYEKFPPSIAQFLGGKPWIKIDLVQLGNMSGVDFSTLMQAQSSDPTQFLQYLKGASDDVVEIGKQVIRGDDTTHYRATIDFNKAVAAAPPEQQEALRQVAEMYVGQRVPTDVWVDDEGRLRRMSFTVDLSKLQLPEGTAAAQQKLTGTMTTNMELFEFGVAVDAVPPPADQVTDLGALLSAGAGG